MPEQKVPVKVNETSWWFQNLHLSGSIALFLLVVTFGVITLAPDIQLLLRQRAEIVEVEQSIELSKQALEDMQSERDRWQDPAYIRSQARERLYYVLPGEVSYLVMDAEGIDLSSQTGTLGQLLAEQRESDVISQGVIAAEKDWVQSSLESIFRAALDVPEEEENEISLREIE